MDRSPRRVLALQLYTGRVAVAHQCLMRNTYPRCRRCVSQHDLRRHVGDVAAIQLSRAAGGSLCAPRTAQCRRGCLREGRGVHALSKCLHVKAMAGPL